jgi:hypothetical protein
MKTIRRFYFYLLALISIEVVIWGVVDLLTNAVLRQPVGGASVLARGLSMLLVGLPIFLLHWRVIQNDARRDEEEHGSRLRALFLYTIRWATLAAAVQNVLAWTNRLCLEWFGFNPRSGLVGGGDTNQDNLVVILVNLCVWFYFDRILRADISANLPGETVNESRRLSRYLWVLYSLGIALLGVHQLLSYIFLLVTSTTSVNDPQLANALALVLVGTPLWVWNWLIVQRSLDVEQERLSTLRLVVLYLLSLTGIITFMSTSTYSFSFIVRWILGEPITAARFLNDHRTALSSAAVFGVVWAYFGGILLREISSRPDPVNKAELWRPYHYIMVVLSNVATFVGLWALLDALVQLSFHTLLMTAPLRIQISGSLAALLVGLPIWLRTWGACQHEALLISEIGDHARRSVIRKGYIYFAVFALVVTAMIAAGMVFFLGLDTLLGTPAVDFWERMAERFLGLVLTLVWLIYHIQVLRKDGQIAQEALGHRHAAFPVLLLVAGADSLTGELENAFHRQMPQLPFNVLDLSQEMPNAQHLGVKAVLLQSSLALDPSDTLRAWMAQTAAQRLVIPSIQENWHLLGIQVRSRRETARMAVQSVRRLAEGLAFQNTPSLSPWMVVFIVFGGLAFLQLLLGLFGLLISSFMD